MPQSDIEQPSFLPGSQPYDYRYYGLQRPTTELYGMKYTPEQIEAALKLQEYDRQHMDTDDWKKDLKRNSAGDALWAKYLQQQRMLKQQPTQRSADEYKGPVFTKGVLHYQNSPSASSAPATQAMKNLLSGLSPQS